MPATTTTPQPTPLTWKVSEYAARERVSENTVRNWIKKGAVKVKRIGPVHLIRIIEPNE